MLLALVVVVLVLSNYKGILSGFTSLASAPAPTPAPATPAAQYASATGQATLPGPGGQLSPASGGGLITASSPLQGHALPSLSSITGAAAGAVGANLPSLVSKLLTI
jgi:hypothetical protein